MITIGLYGGNMLKTYPELVDTFRMMGARALYIDDVAVKQGDVLLWFYHPSAIPELPKDYHRSFNVLLTCDRRDFRRRAGPVVRSFGPSSFYTEVLSLPSEPLEIGMRIISASALRQYTLAYEFDTTDVGQQLQGYAAWCEQQANRNREL